MNRISKLALSAAFTLGFTSFVSAAPILSQIVQDAPAVSDNHGSYAFLTDTDGRNDNIVAALILEAAGLKDSNAFGLYKRNTSGEVRAPASYEMIEIFSGSASVHSDVELQFTADGAVKRVEFGADTVVVEDFGTVFGFYLQSEANTWYTDYRLNEDGVDHAGFYDVAGLGWESGASLVVAFEDLHGDKPGFDGDFNDMVVAISDVATVPEPGSLALLGIGLLAVGLSRARQS